MQKRSYMAFAFGVVMIGALPHSAVAGGGVDVGIGIGLPLAPGHTFTSPGQVFKAAKTADSTTALRPVNSSFRTGRQTQPRRFPPAIRSPITDAPRNSRCFKRSDPPRLIATIWEQAALLRQSANW